MESQVEQKFPLPEQIVEEVYSNINPTIQFVKELLESNQLNREEYRKKLDEDGIINTLKCESADLKLAGVDGSYSAKNTIGVDLAVVAAVRVSQDDDLVFKGISRAFPRLGEAGIVLKGLMAIMELELLSQSKSDITILDGSFYTLLFHINALFSYLRTRTRSRIWKELHPLMKGFLESRVFPNVVRSDNIIANSKHTTTNIYIPSRFPELEEMIDDRAFFSITLLPGEYTTPKRDVAEVSSGRGFHLSDLDRMYPYADEVAKIYSDGFFHFTFFRPHAWSPAYKIELPSSVIKTNKLEEILLTFKKDILDATITEPYQQFLADKIARQSVGAGDAIFDGALNGLSQLGFPIEDIYRYLKPYRTEEM